MSIALLEFSLVKAFKKRGIVCRRNTDGVLRIEEANRLIDITLMNLYNGIAQKPEQKLVLIQEFVDRVCEQLKKNQITEENTTQMLYPRVLAHTSTKATSHPWTQSFLGKHLEIAIVTHQEGRLQFLSPIQVVSFPGGLQASKRQALKNLSAFAEQVDVIPVHKTVWRVHHPEVLTSSLVLLLDRLLSSVHSVPSVNTKNIQFAVPNRGTLWFSTDTLVSFEQHIYLEFTEGSHSIAPSIFQTTLESIRLFRQSWGEQ